MDTMKRWNVWEIIQLNLRYKSLNQAIFLKQLIVILTCIFFVFKKMEFVN